MRGGSFGAERLGHMPRGAVDILARRYPVCPTARWQLETDVGVELGLASSNEMSVGPLLELYTVITPSR